MPLRSLLRLISRKVDVSRSSDANKDPINEVGAVDPDDPFPEVVTIEFGDVIDLHSIPPRQVKAVVEDYLDEARRQKTRWVRIIHGKGIGVQREMVRSILERTPHVLDFRDAPPEAGGWGATVVTLQIDDIEGQPD